MNNDITYNEYHEKVFTDRGIPLWLAKARPYKDWTTDDLQALREEFDYGSLMPKQKQHLTKIGHQVDGLVICRRAPERVTVPERELHGELTRAPYPELRPSARVRTKGSGAPHWHGQDENVFSWESPKGIWVKVNGYGDRKVRRLKRPETIKQHVEKDFAPNPDPARFPNESPDGVWYFYGGHGGVNTDEPHFHLRLPKYVFSVNFDVERWHDHAKPPFKNWPVMWQKGHLKKHHKVKYNPRDGQYHPDAPRYKGTDGRHSHMVEDKAHGLAQRIDVHELAEPLFENAEVVFFGIEGCLKADSILAKGEAVFSVPAVWQFRAPELPEFAEEYLQDKLVIIVPDSDWNDPKKEGQVIRAAAACKEHLFSLGVDALIAAPPSKDGEKAGIDDHLGAEGSLEDLEVVNYEPDSFAVTLLLSWDRMRWDAVRNTTMVYRHLAIAAGPDGAGKLNRRDLHRRLGISDKAVARAVRRLEDEEVLHVTEDSYVLAKPYRVQATEPERLGDVLKVRNRHLTKALVTH